MADRHVGRLASEAEWAVLVARAPFDGVYGVVTTGIVCVTGCPARAPLRRNLRIFENLAAAQAAGYRSCKRCGAGLGKTSLPRDCRA